MTKASILLAALPAALAAAGWSRTREQIAAGGERNGARICQPYRSGAVVGPRG